MLARYQSTLPTLTTGQAGDFQLTSRGAMFVALTDTNGTAMTSTVASDGQAFTNQGLTVNSREMVSNGATEDKLAKPNQTARLLSSAATNNATNVKASTGNVHKIVGNNTVAVKKYLKLFNKATAPVPGTDTPVLTFVLPISAAFSFDLSDLGTYFSVGIGYAITAAAADADNTAIGAGDIECMNILYS